MNDINDRIKYIVDQYYKSNVTAFAREVGATQGTIRDIITGRRNSPTAKTIEKILNVDAIKINSAWLLTGEGAMLKTDPPPIQLTSRGSDEKEIKIKMLQERINELTELNRELERKNAILDYISREKKSQSAT